MLRDLLAGEGIKVGRLHMRTLMKRLGIEALYRKPNTSKPAPGHKIYPYLLRKLPVTRPSTTVAHMRVFGDGQWRLRAGVAAASVTMPRQKPDEF
jgi:hypothetical protein